MNDEKMSIGKAREIQRRASAIDKQDVLNLIQQAQNHVSKSVDGVIIAHIFKLVFTGGLHREEILSMKIRDVIDKRGIARNHLSVGSGSINVPAIMKKDLVDYLNYLKSRGYPTNRIADLFPTTRHASREQSEDARKRKLHRDMEQIAGRHRFILERIRQAGIREFYDTLANGMTEKDKVAETAKFARCSVDFTESILKSRKPETNKPAPSEFALVADRLAALRSHQGTDEELKKLAVDLIEDIKRVKDKNESDPFLKKELIKRIEILVARKISTTI